MSTNNCILNLLNIKDKNIFTSEIIEMKKIKGILSYNPHHCPNCGCINNGHEDIIKWDLEEIVKSKYLIF